VLQYIPALKTLILDTCGGESAIIRRLKDLVVDVGDTSSNDQACGVKFCPQLQMLVLIKCDEISIGLLREVLQVRNTWGNSNSAKGVRQGSGINHTSPAMSESGPTNATGHGHGALHCNSDITTPSGVQRSPSHILYISVSSCLSLKEDNMFSLKEFDVEDIFWRTDSCDNAKG
jgi:hypothetical protein